MSASSLTLVVPVQQLKLFNSLKNGRLKAVGKGAPARESRLVSPATG